MVGGLLQYGWDKAPSCPAFEPLGCGDFVDDDEAAHGAAGLFGIHPWAGPWDTLIVSVQLSFCVTSDWFKVITSSFAL